MPEGDGASSMVLGLLVDAAGVPVAVEEIVDRYAGFSGERQAAEVAVSDALEDLASFGLVRRLDGFAVASRAAQRFRELDG